MSSGVDFPRNRRDLGRQRRLHERTAGVCVYVVDYRPSAAYDYFAFVTTRDIVGVRTPRSFPIEIKPADFFPVAFPLDE